MRKFAGFCPSASLLKTFSAWAVAAGLSISAVASHAATADDTKIAVVDMHKALVSVDAGKKAKASLDKEVAAKTKELQDEKASITKAGEEFKKQSLVMNEEARARKQGELQERVLKWQEKAQRTQAELQQKEQDLTRPMIDKLRTIIADTAKKKGYHLVLEKAENMVLYSQDKDDLTNDVVSAFNSQSKS